MKGKAQGIKLGKSHHCSDPQTNRQCFIAENQNEPLGRACHELCWPVGWRGGQSMQSCCAAARWMQEDASWMRHPASVWGSVWGIRMLWELQTGILPLPGALVTCLDRALSGLPLLWLLSLLEILWGDLWMGDFCSRFPCVGLSVSLLLSSQLGGYTSVLSALGAA